jgi:hypothetical protein
MRSSEILYQQAVSPRKHLHEHTPFPKAACSQAVRNGRTIPNEKRNSAKVLKIPEIVEEEHVDGSEEIHYSLDLG